MAEKFQPQTFNINFINEGNRFNLSNGISPNAVNAPIEAAAYVQSLATNQPNVENADKVGSPTVSIELAPNGTPRFKFENLKGGDGTDNSQEIDEINSNITDIRKEQSEQNSQIEATEKEVHNIKQALLQNEVLVVSKIPNKTTTRITAGGENIVDDQYTAVTEIRGSTVRCENLFDKSKISSADFANCTDTSISEDKNVLIATGKENEADSEFGYSTGWVRPLNVSAKTAGVYCEVGDRLTVSADITLITQGSRAAKVKCYVLQSSANSGLTPVNEKSISATKTRLSWNFTINKEERYYPVFPINSNRVRIENIKMSKDGSTEYQPYFSDLKHANISAIKSTGRNLYDFELDKGNRYIANGTILSTTIAGYECKGNLGATPYTYSYDNGWLYFNGNNTKALPILEVGTKLKASFDITLLETVEGYESFRLGCYLIDIGEENKYFYLKNITTTQSFTVSFVVKKLSQKGYTQFAVSVGSLHYVIENFTVNIGNTAYPREPYTEDIYQLPETLELGEWDSFNPQTGEVLRQTETITFDGSSDEGWKLMTGTYPYAYYKLGDLGTVIDDMSVASRYDANPNISVSNNTECGYRLFNSATGGDARIIVRPSSDYNFDNLNAWLTELRSNPLTVSYKLETPTIEKIENAPKLYKAWNKGSESVIQGEIDNSIYGAMPTITNEYILRIGGEE